MIFFGGVRIPRFGVLMKWVRFFHLHFFGIRLSTIQRILYGALLAFTTFLFLRFSSPLVDSSFTIFRGVRAFVVRFGSVFSWVTLCGLVYILSARSSHPGAVYIYTLSSFFFCLFLACSFFFFFQAGVWAAERGVCWGIAFFHPVFCGFFCFIFFVGGIFHTLRRRRNMYNGLADTYCHLHTYTPQQTSRNVVLKRIRNTLLYIFLRVFSFVFPLYFYPSTFPSIFTNFSASRAAYQRFCLSASSVLITYSLSVVTQWPLF